MISCSHIVAATRTGDGRRCGAPASVEVRGVALGANGIPKEIVSNFSCLFHIDAMSEAIRRDGYAVEVETLEESN